MRMFSPRTLSLALAACGAACAAGVECVAVSFPEGATVRLVLEATERLPGASGQAQVRRRPGVTEFEIELRGLKPAVSFGGDLNTYVAWAIAPEGWATNAGELITEGDRARLKATTPLGTFALIVTAEPHFLVEEPSEFVVLKNSAAGLERRPETTPAAFRLDRLRAGYKSKLATLADAAAVKGTLRTDRFQALVAVRLAEEAGAREHAPEEFAQAETALRETEQAFAQPAGEAAVARLAERALRLAVAAARTAHLRAQEQARAAERRQWEETLARLRRERDEAAGALAAARDEARRAREALEQTKKELQNTERQLLALGEQADRYARQKLEAEKQAEAARRDAVAMVARLGTALGRAVEAERTERGWRITLPDDAFTRGRAELRPGARELLSRLAGVLLVAPEFRITIEGHSDSAGSPARNQRFSEQRAAGVREYLIQAHLDPARIEARGLGAERPVASNRTAAGRQRNRRVEIYIEGLGTGH
ncbi:MAG TPA: OmpA family protein [Bryobacteraceae bacterium]|nr:OmpA family protein [Bryobacteraceae bacterium]